MAATRYVLTGPSGKTVEVTGKLLAGRNPDCDLVLVVGNPSRRHAQFTPKDDGVWLEDLRSANGTFVNEQKITAPVQLRSGDRIRFDAEKWEFSVVEPPSLETATVLRSPNTKTVIPNTTQVPRPPGSWALSDSKDPSGTRLFTAEELKQQLLADAAPSPAPAPVADVDAPYLSVKSGKHAGQNLKLKMDKSTNRWEIGSDPAKKILISDPGVSSFHATITNEGKRWKVRDQMSANGTFVNGQKTNISFLASGDRILFGPVECVFQLPASAKQEAATGRRPLLIAGASFAVTAVLIALGWWFLH